MNLHYCVLHCNNEIIGPVPILSLPSSSSSSSSNSNIRALSSIHFAPSQVAFDEVYTFKTTLHFLTKCTRNTQLSEPPAAQIHPEVLLSRFVCSLNHGLKSFPNTETRKWGQGREGLQKAFPCKELPR